MDRPGCRPASPSKTAQDFMQNGSGERPAHLPCTSVPGVACCMHRTGLDLRMNARNSHRRRRCPPLPMSRSRCPPLPWSRRRCPSSLPRFCHPRLCSLLRSDFCSSSSSPLQQITSFVQYRAYAQAKTSALDRETKFLKFRTNHKTQPHGCSLICMSLGPYTMSDPFVSSKPAGCSFLKASRAVQANRLLMLCHA
jgi:hypothetical protein